MSKKELQMGYDASSSEVFLTPKDREGVDRVKGMPKDKVIEEVDRACAEAQMCLLDSLDEIEMKRMSDESRAPGKTPSVPDLALDGRD
jgi:hypothetical protein